MSVFDVGFIRIDDEGNEFVADVSNVSDLSLNVLGANTTRSIAVSVPGLQGPPGPQGPAATIDLLDATPTSKGVIQLSNDLSGTAEAPTVTALDELRDQQTLELIFEGALV